MYSQQSLSCAMSQIQTPAAQTDDSRNLSGCVLSHPLTEPTLPTPTMSGVPSTCLVVVNPRRKLEIYKCEFRVFGLSIFDREFIGPVVKWEASTRFPGVWVQVSCQRRYTEKAFAILDDKCVFRNLPMMTKIQGGNNRKIVTTHRVVTCNIRDAAVRREYWTSGIEAVLSAATKSPQWVGTDFQRCLNNTQWKSKWGLQGSSIQVYDDVTQA
ncbi:hypothetical protein C8J56DRAFT_883491 [Mycena floridula]|nr:hypothetical protein C8J56DRAFT_883491 [Mycena floridula]